MLTPMEAHNDVAFTIAPEGESSNVTWAMQGQVPFMAKIFHVLFDVDKMVGNDFEQGLRDLKALAEK